jgi:hypothetical protein
MAQPFFHSSLRLSFSQSFSSHTATPHNLLQSSEHTSSCAFSDQWLEKPWKKSLRLGCCSWHLTLQYTTFHYKTCKCTGSVNLLLHTCYPPFSRHCLFIRNHRYAKYHTNLETGLQYNHAERQQFRYEMGANIIPPPVDCPAWLCCLLPCLLKTKKMKYYRSLQVKVVEVSDTDHTVTCIITAFTDIDSPLQ